MSRCSITEGRRRVARRAHRAGWIATLALGMPGLAFADYNVTIDNLDERSYNVKHTDRHVCIGDPGYFDKHLPSSGTIQVTAKWLACSPSDSPHIEFCIDGPDVAGRCYTLQQYSDVKYLQIVDGKIFEQGDD